MSFNNTTATVNVFETAAVTDFAQDLPEQYERVAAGFRLIENHLPDGRAYTCAQYGLREHALFMKGRADLMVVDPCVDGAVSIDVLTARADVPSKRLQYFIGADGIDHMCTTRALGPGRTVVKPYNPRGMATSHNPEAIDRRTGFLKTDYAGGVAKTIQYEILTSNGLAYREVPEATNSYERGVYLLGAAIQRGGYRAIKSQVNKWAIADAAGTFTNEIGDVHFLEFLGHMGQKTLTPVAWFVEAGEGYQEKPLTAQKVHGTPFINPTCCFTAWTDMLAHYKTELGVYMKFAATA